MKLPDQTFIKGLLMQIAEEEILPRFNKTGYEIKSDGSLLTDADLATDRRIQKTLASAYPDIAFLSEEMALDEQENLLADEPLLWCLDPLDGTSNFSAGIPLFATSLALLNKGKVVMGFTYDPVRNEMFSAVNEQGAWLNNQRLYCKPAGISLSRSTAIVDFKRLSKPLLARLLRNPPYKSQRNLGSCALEWAWMAANRGHIYLHGGMKLWDLAAGSLILDEARGYASTLQGKKVFKATMQPRSVILSPDEKLFQQWSDYLNNS